MNLYKITYFDTLKWKFIKEEILSENIDFVYILINKRISEKDRIRSFDKEDTLSIKCIHENITFPYILKSQN